MIERLVRQCRAQVRRRGEIPLDVDSNRRPQPRAAGIELFPRRLRSAHAPPVDHQRAAHHPSAGSAAAAGPGKLGPGRGGRLARRLGREFPRARLSPRLRADAGFALPQLYEFCKFFGIEYAIGIATNDLLKLRAELLRARLAERRRRGGTPQRGRSSFHHRTRSWGRRRGIRYKAEHNGCGTSLRFLVTDRRGSAADIFAFYNDRGECENRIEELKSGFAGDRLTKRPFARSRPPSPRLTSPL